MLLLVLVLLVLDALRKQRMKGMLQSEETPHQQVGRMHERAQRDGSAGRVRIKTPLNFLSCVVATGS